MLPATAYGADHEYGEDDAAEDILKLWKTEDADEPSEDDEDEDTNEDNSDDEDDSDDDAHDEPSEDDEDASDDEDGEDEGEADDNGKKKTLSDDVVVKVKVGDTEEEVPVSKLTRLYGQEKALTQKSMEVAEQRKQLEANSERHVAAAEGLMKRAAARFEPYSKVDWGLAVKNLSDEEYVALRSEATAAYEDWKFYEQELDGYVAEVKKVHESERLNSARTTLKALSDPKTGIPGFDKQMYTDMRDYAVSVGLTAEAFGSIVDEAPLRLMHKAMLYDKGKAAVTTKVEKKNKKIVKARTNGSVTRETFKKSTSTNAMKQFQRTGSSDDAAEALLARWTQSDD